MTLADNLRNSVMVIAHPDDEILWFSSLLRRVDHIVFCFSGEMADPEFGARRTAAVSNYPLENSSSLGLVSMGIWRPQVFLEPKFNQYGMELVGSDSRYSAYKKKYRENYDDLRKKLAEMLGMYRVVITHNPWGEYGHEEHVQVHKVIKDLQKEIGYAIWHSTYCSTRTIGLVNQYLSAAKVLTLPPDHVIAKDLMGMYEEYDCWTWYKDWTWPAQETFFEQSFNNSDPGSEAMLVPLNHIVLPPLSPEVRGWTLYVRKRLKRMRTLAQRVRDELPSLLSKLSGI